MSWWTPVRPGEVVKKAFLTTGATYSASQLFRVYRNTVTVWNEDQGRKSYKDRFHGMKYNSFRTFISRWIKGGLLEKVGEEPLQFGGERKLVGIRDGQVVEQTMTMLAITDKGRAEEAGWLTPQIYDLEVAVVMPPIPTGPPPEVIPSVLPPRVLPAKKAPTKKAPPEPEPEGLPPELADIKEKYSTAKRRMPHLAIKELEALANQYDVEDVIALIDEYVGIDRSDFDSGAEGDADYKEDRTRAWAAWLEALGDV